MTTNDEIKKLLYSLKHSYDDKDLQERLNLLEKLIDRKMSADEQSIKEAKAEIKKEIIGKMWKHENEINWANNSLEHVGYLLAIRDLVVLLGV